ncbi:unnamed protein product [Spirodela intermedia]|uniref:Uncharacterized protein n=1 Tax=Spirodela intermedia TaxID=51605 RepID=A0A7I8J2V4_SPIIN|nr:unnamed protein product [Spirodela intermedia]CAA6664447.1 unnamed protein product [Spirodela intermedia]
MGAEADELQRRLPATEDGGRNVNGGNRSARPSSCHGSARRLEALASARRAEVARKRAEDIAAGAQMNGRELFLHEPWVFDNSKY